MCQVWSSMGTRRHTSKEGFFFALREHNCFRTIEECKDRFDLSKTLHHSFFFALVWLIAYLGQESEILLSFENKTQSKHLAPFGGARGAPALPIVAPTILGFTYSDQLVRCITFWLLAMVPKSEKWRGHGTHKMMPWVLAQPNLVQHIVLHRGPQLV